MASKACTPAPASSPGSIFDDDWKSFDGDGSNAYKDLDYLDLDDILGPIPTKPPDVAATINPHSLDGAANPDSIDNTNHRLTHHATNNDEDNIFVRAAPEFESSAHHVTASPSTFHHLTEESHDFDFGQYVPQPFRHEFHHRRSVSEPPAALPNDDGIHYWGVPAPPQPAMTFTRSGVTLGTPKVHHSNRMTRVKHPHVQKPYPTPRAWTQERYHLRRSNTQPQRHGPTSVPTVMHQIHHTPPPAMMQQPMCYPVQAGSPSVTSRVCTPAPSPPQLHPGEVPARPYSSAAPCEERKPLSIPLTVEELRIMITEAVQTALSGAEVRSSTQKVDGADGGVGVKGEEEA